MVVFEMNNFAKWLEYRKSERQCCVSLCFDQITEPLLMQTYAVLFFVSFVLCIVIILASGYGFSRRAYLDAVRYKVHILVLYLGLVASQFVNVLGLLPLLSFGFIPLSVVLV